MGTIFLFGAGASHGSDTHNTPPLGADLFEALRQFNPLGWGTITGDLAAAFRSDFETAFPSVAPHALAPLQRAMAAYFFEFRPCTSSLYFELARRIAGAKGWSGAACTLNYDLLLELSLLGASVLPVIGKPTSGSPRLELCLPHGCCHLFCNAAQADASGVSFHGHCVKTDGPVTRIVDPRQHRTRIEKDAFPPVMSYFEPKKDTTTGSSFIDEHRLRWHELAMSATTIVVVGVRVRPHDDHVWEPIASSAARVVYCAGSSGASEYRNWAATTRARRRDRVLAGSFREEFSAICTAAGL